jgi:hypothetical protein
MRADRLLRRAARIRQDLEEASSSIWNDFLQVGTLPRGGFATRTFLSNTCLCWDKAAAVSRPVRLARA